METVALLQNGKTIGEITLQAQGLYTLFHANVFTLDDTLQAVYLTGDGGSVRLGVIEKIGRGGQLKRSLSNQSWRHVGQLSHGDLRPAQDSPWQTLTTAPIKSPYLQKHCHNLPDGLWKPQGNGMEIALPYHPQKPYPLMAFFCFARFLTVEHIPYLVVALDDMELPMV